MTGITRITNQLKPNPALGNIALFQPPDHRFWLGFPRPILSLLTVAVVASFWTIGSHPACLTILSGFLAGVAIRIPITARVKFLKAFRIFIGQPFIEDSVATSASFTIQFINPRFSTRTSELLRNLTIWILCNILKVLFNRKIKIPWSTWILLTQLGKSH